MLNPCEQSSPTEPGIKRLAIQTEDHTLEYADFEGEIPQEQSGAGTVPTCDREGLMVEYLKENEKILFELSGDKMQGRAGMRLSRLNSVGRKKTGIGCFSNGNEISNHFVDAAKIDLFVYLFS